MFLPVLKQLIDNDSTPITIGLEVLLRFLFEFGLPWLGFRRATRMGDSTKMSSMYAVALPWFRATKKHQYARICIDFAYVLLKLNPVLLDIFNKYRTVSLLGNKGRNIGQDQACEFLNLDLKSMDPKSPEHIDRILLGLNGVKSVDERMRKSLGVEREDPSEYTQVKPDHVASVVSALKAALGSNMGALFTAQVKESPFGGGPRPWVKVRNPGNLPGGASRTNAECKQHNMDWALSQLQSNPFPAD